MSIKPKQIDALLVHCYWYDLNEKELDICNHLQILAASILWHKHRIKNIVITAGHIFKGKPAIGEEIKEHLLAKLPPRARKSVILVPRGKTTRKEITEFQKITQGYGWQNLSSLGLAIHLPRIKSIFRKIFGRRVDKVVFYCTEDVLKRDGHTALVKKYKRSLQSRILARNELVTRKIDQIPLLGGYLLELTARFLPSKGHLQPKIISWFVN